MNLSTPTSPHVAVGKLLAVIAALFLTLALAGCHAKKAATGSVSDGGYSPSPSLPSRIAAAADAELPEATKLLMAEADTWLGTPYRYGAAERGRGADCSGFVMAAYANALALKLPRSSREQMEWCAPVKGGVKKAVPGDLVFFATGKKNKVSHVGIYLGNGQVVHASTSKGVIISRLDDDYYTRTYHSTGRVEPYYAMLSKHASKSANKAKSADLANLATPAVQATPAPPKPSTRLTVAAEAPDTALTPDEARRRLLLRLAETDSLSR